MLLAVSAAGCYGRSPVNRALVVCSGGHCKFYPTSSLSLHRPLPEIEVSAEFGVGLWNSLAMRSSGEWFPPRAHRAFKAMLVAARVPLLMFLILTLHGDIQATQGR
jgi:hypothetical protein